jgi:hypothetical protein
MTQFAFGSGTLIGKRTDVTGTPPALLGTLQDVSIDFDRKIETLLGQYNTAVAAGGGEFKITGKAKFARLQTAQINNLFLGQTLAANSMLEMTTGETDTVASGAVTVANSATFVEDYGVFYASSGAQLSPVTASPSQGQYSVASGVYSFNTADNGAAVLIYYSYTVSSGNKISLANQLTGPLPMFEMRSRRRSTITVRPRTWWSSSTPACRQSCRCRSPIRNSPSPNSISRPSPMRRTISAPSA